MDLAALRTLPTGDQQVYLLGRICTEALDMEARLRIARMRLLRTDDPEELKRGDWQFSKLTAECSRLAAGRNDLPEGIKAAFAADVSRASELYDRRNRFMHDVLQNDMASDGWELIPISGGKRRQRSSVSFDDMVELVEAMVTTTWRLLAAERYFQEPDEEWEEFLHAPVVGRWDGSCGWTS